MTPFDHQHLVNDEYENVVNEVERAFNTPATQSTCTQTCGCTESVDFDAYVPPQQQQSSFNTPATQSTCTQTCGCTESVDFDSYVPPQQQQSSFSADVPATKSTCTQTCGCDGDSIQSIDFVAPTLK